MSEKKRKDKRKKKEDFTAKQKTRLLKDGSVQSGYTIHDKPVEYKIFGREFIEPEALSQMNMAMRLPVSIAGALMPDAHSGYGLPIGGVLATRNNIVIPYAVGVDIACRMCLSVFNLEPSIIESEKKRLKTILYENTIFGVGGMNKKHIDASVFDLPEWKATDFIRSLQNRAYSQLGTSGAGNHFVEWGILEVTGNHESLPLDQGSYLAVLSHSGSRGFGNDVASHFSKLAMKQVVLPKEARHLAWLDLDSDEGREYWTAMTLAGHFASANHREIHTKIAKALGYDPVCMIENHHNFAWKETLSDGTPVIIHRKGATPAGKGDIGIIPGSMTAPGFVVRGKGNLLSLNSASHGAGRKMSRSAATKSIKRFDLDHVLQEAGVVLMGGDTDEAPMAYKDIRAVMKCQTELVEKLARFTPKIVRMA